MIASTLLHRARARPLLRRIDSIHARGEQEREMAQMEVLWAAAVGLSMSDPISSAWFSSRHLVFALRSGNVYRLALALAGEATQHAHYDGGQDGRPKRLLEVAWRYARRSGDSHALAFVHCMAGIVAFLGGRWAESATESERALTLLRQDCTGVSWEVATAASFMCAAHLFRGNLRTHARLLPTFVADARARGDLYAAEVLPVLTLSWVPYLVTDDPAGASGTLPALPAKHGRTRWRIHDTNALSGWADTAVYRGEPERAWALFEEYWPSIRRSLLMRIITIRTLLSMTRTRCAISLAASNNVGPSERRDLLRTAERSATSIERTRSGWACALALALRAGIASCRGQDKDSVQLLERAAADLQAFELMPWYYSARWQLTCKDERRERPVPPPDDWWTTEGIVRPDRLANLLVPGAWRHSEG